jgi:hypothetical protein
VGLTYSFDNVRMWDCLVVLIIRHSIVASIPACHAGDQGSIPCVGIPFYSTVVCRILREILWKLYDAAALSFHITFAAYFSESVLQNKRENTTKRGIYRENEKIAKIKTSDTGNRTLVSRVTGGDTSHYTMSECRKWRIFRL